MTTPKFTIGHQMSESDEQHTASAPSNLRCESGAKPKFTQEPWGIDVPNMDESLLGIRAGDYVICDMQADGYSSEEQKANAHLIAAAPELYEALNELVQWLELGDHECYMHAKAVAALSKARGEGVIMSTNDDGLKTVYEVSIEAFADLLARLCAAEVDAGRYRWLRSDERTVVVRDSCSHLYGDEMDGLIDQEIKEQSK